MRKSTRPESFEDLRREIQSRVKQYRADAKRFDESSPAHLAARLAAKELYRVDVALWWLGVKVPRVTRRKVL